jgi:hypothetical protein
MGAYRHGAQAMGEYKVEAARLRRLEIEVMRRPVAGHLGVTVGQLLVEMLRRRPDRVVSGRVRKAVTLGHRSQIGHSVQAEQDGGPPLFDGQHAVGIELFDVQHNLGSRPCRAHRRDRRPGVQRLAGDERAMQHDVVLAVHAAARLPPGGRRQVPVGCLLRSESQDDRKYGGHRLARQYRRGLITGCSCVCRDVLWVKSSRKQTMPGNAIYFDLAHYGVGNSPSSWRR